MGRAHTRAGGLLGTSRWGCAPTAGCHRLGCLPGLCAPCCHYPGTGPCRWPLVVVGLPHWGAHTPCDWPSQTINTAGALPVCLCAQTRLLLWASGESWARWRRPRMADASAPAPPTGAGADNSNRVGNR